MRYPVWRNGHLISLAAAGLVLGSCHLSLGTDGAGAWSDYLGGPDSAQYSPLADITAGNVSGLKVAWTYPLPGNGQSNGNPLVVDNRMYVPWSGGLLALDPGSGKEIWRVDAPGVRMRGLSSWTDGRSRRIFYNCNDRMFAIDAMTGRPVEAFGEKVPMISAEVSGCWRLRPRLAMRERPST